LKVRQREQLRRTLVMAGGLLAWDILPNGTADPVEEASKHVKKLARDGTRAIAKDLADETADKRAETKQIKGVAKALLKLAKDRKTEYPAEVIYVHTTKNPAQGLVTKTETLTLNDAGEAEDAAANLEKRLPRSSDLKDQMLVELKQKQKVLDEMKAGLPEFVDSSKPLLGEVFAILH